MQGPTPESIERRTILLIDDDLSFAEDVRRILGSNQEFSWLERSDCAVETIRRTRPRVILLDLHMPRRLSRMDEEEGLEVLRRLSSWERARVIVVTKSLSGTARQRLSRLGVERVYLKSEPATRLAALVHRHKPAISVRSLDHSCGQGRA